MKPNKKTSLGRGLDALLDLNPLSSPPAALADASGATSLEVDIEQLSPSDFQPRRNFSAEALNELAASISQQGIMQPLVVRPKADANNQYEIIAGERRWRAAQIAGLHRVPVVVRIANDKEVLALALIENLQRQDLNPLEEAAALHRLMDEFSLNQQEVAALVGKARSSVSNLLRLMNLHQQVQTYLTNGQLDMGHARALLSLPKAQQANLAAQVITQELSVRQTEALVKDLVQPEIKLPVVSVEQPKADPNIQKLEENLALSLGAPVRIHHGKQGKGRLEIRYSSLEELDGILTHIRKP